VKINGDKKHEERRKLKKIDNWPKYIKTRPCFYVVPVFSCKCKNLQKAGILQENTGRCRKTRPCFLALWPKVIFPPSCDFQVHWGYKYPQHQFLEEILARGDPKNTPHTLFSTFYTFIIIYPPSHHPSTPFSSVFHHQAIEDRELRFGFYK